MSPQPSFFSLLTAGIFASSILSAAESAPSLDFRKWQDDEIVRLNAFAGKPEANIPPAIVTEVIERDGNIYSIDKSGKEIPLTSSGVDFEPSLFYLLQI